MNLAPLQPRILVKGREIFERMRGAKPRAFSTRNLTGRLMDWSMSNEDLKVQLFRLVDVLPTLSAPAEIVRHAQEYLGGVQGLPFLARLGLRFAPHLSQLTALAARQGVTRMARTFILAHDAKEALPQLRQMRSRPIAFTADILGETAVSEKEASLYQQRYLQLIEELAADATHWPTVAQIDADHRGPVPKVNVSVKISALCSQINPAATEAALAVLIPRLRPVLERAAQLGAFINFDMESTALKDLTIELFLRLLQEPSLRTYDQAGIALQAYLRNSQEDFEKILNFAQTHNRRVTIRLIKGAYWDTETILARQHGWPVPVFEQKAETDANYEVLARRMLEQERWINCAFGTHSVRSIAACLVQAEALGLPARAVEIQMLHGMAEPIKAALIEMGCRVREYCPLGDILPGMSYLVRRLLENTSNEGFLRATFTDNVSPAALLQDPAEISRSPRPGPSHSSLSRVEPRPSPRAQPVQRAVFENEPWTDFTLTSSRHALSEAIRARRALLSTAQHSAHAGPPVAPLIIGGKKILSGDELISVNPAHPSEIVGRVAKATRAHVEEAVAAAGEAAQRWKYTAAEDRADILDRVADILRRERFEFAALEILETGKNWSESDADVAEAIDFCRYYAGEMRRLAARQDVIPGEASLHHYVPRGVAAVIAPWNFPLAILCGMTTASLVTGNTVILKPAEQSSLIAASFVDVLMRAGMPPGVINFLPGAGEEVGARLVAHPRVDLIAFTGSREVGLKICETAGRLSPGQRQLKKVVCEMGGKNALIVDNDADLDEAVPAILASAFGYQGQKCSALARLIVLPGNRDRLVERLLEATASLTMGLPENPETIIGPVIDREAYERIRKMIAQGKQEAALAFEGKLPSGDGFFIPPTIFDHVPPRARIAQEEIFGPVLSIIDARDLAEALAIANDSAYALTGGFFSRSPAHIAQVTREMEVGNLYINRTITGALVGRHPFGGFKMSGTGTKAGGEDYLPHFMLPRTVTENRLRRGFAPTAGPGE